MFTPRFTKSALQDLNFLRKSEQQKVLAEVKEQLVHDPTKETRNRKPLRPNELSQWELRVGDFRVFYDVDVDKKETLIKAVGEKEHNKLYIRGKEYEL